ncbi:MAG: heme-copper oxidase subunit III [Anaerolineae bacterium]|nr:heme-copper oxidase subunit III [Anaerolineae bacterium]
MALTLESGALFALLAGGTLLLTGLVAGGIAFLVFNLDRERRYVDESVLTPAAAADGGSVALPRLSAVSESVIHSGVVEAPPSLGMSHNKLGMWTFLSSEIMFFTALIGAYVAFRAIGDLVPEHLNVVLSGVGTFVLICSSFTVVLALDAVQENNQQNFVFYLLGSILLGAAFIGIQGYEWAELMSHGVTATSSLFGTAFFVMTGFHGLHVIIGLVWLTLTLLRAFRGDFTPKDNMGVETFGLYWHFVDVVWIVLFTIIYLIQ